MYSAEGRPEHLPIEHPTDVQAEVQVEANIPLSMFLRLDFENDDSLRKFRDAGIDVPNSISVGTNWKLFSERDFYLRKLRN